MCLQCWHRDLSVITSHRLYRTHGWKLMSSRRRGLMKDKVKSGIPLSLIRQSIWNNKGGTPILWFWNFVYEWNYNNQSEIYSNAIGDVKFTSRREKWHSTGILYQSNLNYTRKIPPLHYTRFSNVLYHINFFRFFQVQGLLVRRFNLKDNDFNCLVYRSYMYYWPCKFPHSHTCTRAI